MKHEICVIPKINRKKLIVTLLMIVTMFYGNILTLQAQVNEKKSEEIRVEENVQNNYNNNEPGRAYNNLMLNYLIYNLQYDQLNSDKVIVNRDNIKVTLRKMNNVLEGMKNEFEVIQNSESYRGLDAGNLTQSFGCQNYLCNEDITTLQRKLTSFEESLNYPRMTDEEIKATLRGIKINWRKFGCIALAIGIAVGVVTANPGVITASAVGVNLLCEKEVQER